MKEDGVKEETVKKTGAQKAGKKASKKKASAKKSGETKAKTKKTIEKKTKPTGDDLKKDTLKPHGRGKAVLIEDEGTPAVCEPEKTKEEILREALEERFPVENLIQATGGKRSRLLMILNFLERLDEMVTASEQSKAEADDMAVLHTCSEGGN